MKYLAFLFFFYSIGVQAQFRVTGIIKDEATKTPLPFATVQSSSGRTTVADITGKFEFISSAPGEKMTVTYLNYTSKEYTIEKTAHFSIFLKPSIAFCALVFLIKINNAIKQRLIVLILFFKIEFFIGKY